MDEKSEKILKLADEIAKSHAEIPSVHVTYLEWGFAILRHMNEPAGIRERLMTPIAESMAQMDCAGWANQLMDIVKVSKTAKKKSGQTYDRASPWAIRGEEAERWVCEQLKEHEIEHHRYLVGEEGITPLDGLKFGDMRIVLPMYNSLNVDVKSGFWVSDKSILGSQHVNYFILNAGSKSLVETKVVTRRTLLAYCKKVPKSSKTRVREGGDLGYNYGRLSKVETLGAFLSRCVTVNNYCVMGQ